jgi:hypothetical protein
MRAGRRAVPILVLGWSLGSGCTVAMYPGPKRPAAETALIKQAGASIEGIDGMKVPVGSQFVVLPGPHSVEARSGAAMASTCFVARAGHAYMVETSADHPVVMDYADAAMRTYRLRDDQSCDRLIAEAEAERRAPRTVPVAAPPAATSSPPDATGEAREEAFQPAAPRAVARSENDDAPSAPPAADAEQPRAFRRRPFQPGPRRLVYHDEPAEPPPRKPGFGVIFEWGIGGGGAELVSVEYTDGSSGTLSLGDGISISMGLMWTPIWIGDDLGIGLSGTAGYKGWQVGASNGDASINRFPLTLALHVMPRVAARWFLFARGGIDKEVGVSISASGIVGNGSADLSANLGWFGEGGFYKIMETEEQRGAWSLTFRYTDLSYATGYGPASARSFMIFNAFYFNP